MKKRFCRNNPLIAPRFKDITKSGVKEKLETSAIAFFGGWANSRITEQRKGYLAFNFQDLIFDQINPLSISSTLFSPHRPRKLRLRFTQIQPDILSPKWAKLLHYFYSAISRVRDGIVR